MKFCFQKKNYSFLALYLNCQNQERKKHISPALGKSPRIEKCHFPSTGEIPQRWEPLDCVLCIFQLLLFSFCVFCHFQEKGHLNYCVLFHFLQISGIKYVFLLLVNP